MKLTTQQCVSILNLISKMGLKGEIISSFKKVGALESKNQIVSRKILDKLKGKEQNVENIAEVLSKNEDLRLARVEIDGEYQELMIGIIFTILERIPQNEELFYSTLGNIYNEDVNTVKGLDGDVTYDRVFEIINSETFKSFFSKFMK